MRYFKDPIYNYITCSDHEMDIVDSAWLQRLRHCSQNGPARLVYPTLVGSRFEHSLGVMYLAEKMLRSILELDKYKDDSVLKNFLDCAREDISDFYGEVQYKTANDHEIIDILVRWIRLAGLCHDIGHFPLSHSLEGVFEDLYWRKMFPEHDPQRACHELISAEFVRQIAFHEDDDPLYKTSLGEDIIKKDDARAIILLLLSPKIGKIGGRGLNTTIFATLHKIIVGTYDVDRLDYLQRDAHFASGNLDLIDIERVFLSLRLDENDCVDDNEKLRFEILPTAKAISAIEALLIERYKQKKWTHYHHKVVFYDRMVKEAAKDILSRTEDEMFTDYKLDEAFVSHVDSKGEFCQKIYYTEAIRKLTNNQEAGTMPLMLYIKNIRREKVRIIDSSLFVKNALSHFIDDIWFSQSCREKGRDEIIVNTLVKRGKTGLTTWKTPDVFCTFWTKVIHGISELTTVENILEGKPEHQKNFKLDLALEAVVRDEKREYEVMFGTTRARHTENIEKLISKEWEVCNQYHLKAYIAYVRWKNLFYDRSPSEEPLMVFVSPKRHASLPTYSGLINSLINLRGEILFYVFLSGSEDNIREAKQHLGKKFSEEIKTLAELYVKGIDAGLSGFLVNAEKRKFAKNLLLDKGRIQ